MLLHDFSLQYKWWKYGLAKLKGPNFLSSAREAAEEYVALGR